jgi:L-amino acid N-acyltransferase YncA
VDVRIRPALEPDLGAINRIYNDEILHRTNTWELEPWPIERRQEWFAEHEADPTLTVLAADVDGECVGFAYLSLYRPRAGYRYTRESTVYVDLAFHRRGVGRALMTELLLIAHEQPVRALLAVIEASNIASIELHRAFGYEQNAVRKQVGRKFGRWLDSVEMELVLPFEPAND